MRGRIGVLALSAGLAGAGVAENDAITVHSTVTNGVGGRWFGR